jgi:hypothetical protein
MVGDENKTVKWMERSADLREWQAPNISVNPVFAPMQKSPGFVALKRRMGSSDSKPQTQFEILNE